ncbi:MAG: hypothetical protein WA865_19510 [Spirulinaceae cyanobacterium]
MKLEVFWQYLTAPQIYYPQLAKATGGVVTAVFLGEIIQRQFNLPKGQNAVQITTEEMTTITGMSSVEQDLARNQLRGRSLLQFQLINQEDELWELIIDWQVLERLLTNSDTVAFTPTKLVAKVKSDPFFPVRRQPISVQVTPHYQFSGPWQTSQEFEAFQKALFNYAKNLGFSNPSGWVFKIIDSISKGIISPYWEEFNQGIPFGTSQKVQQEWEVEPGVAYPALEEERTQYYLQKGEPLESAVARARADLRNPVLAKDLWAGFLRKCDRLADEAIKAKEMGVTAPNLPPSFTAKNQVTKASVIAKLEQIAPQFSLPQEEEKPQTKEEETVSQTRPSIESLAGMYHTPIGKSLVTKQINQNPHWGYAIVEDKIVDSTDH